MADDAQPVEGQDAPPVETAPTEPATLADSPWKGVIESTFEDPAIRSQVDGLFRENVQPYVTKLEQDGKINENAKELYSDLQENPIATHLALTEELFGEETRDELLNLLNGSTDGSPAPEAPSAEPAVDNSISLDQLPPEVAGIVRTHQEQEQAKAYHAALDQAIEADAELTEADKDLIHPFVASAGSIEAALPGYKVWRGQAQAAFNPEAEGTTPEAEGAAAPPALGGDGGASGSLPTEQQYDSIDDFVRGTVAELGALKAPPVGS